MTDQILSSSIRFAFMKCILFLKVFFFFFLFCWVSHLLLSACSLVSRGWILYVYLSVFGSPPQPSMINASQLNTDKIFINFCVILPLDHLPSSVCVYMRPLIYGGLSADMAPFRLQKQNLINVHYMLYNTNMPTNMLTLDPQQSVFVFTLTHAT